MRDGTRFYCETAPIGFNIYDNDEKCRLKTTYQSRDEAKEECELLNHEQFQDIFMESGSMAVL